MLLVLPGSRRSEIRHHMTAFGVTLDALAGRRRRLRSRAADHAASRRGDYGRAEILEVQPRVVIGDDEKRAAFRIAHAALAKSGTVTLELALAGVPMVAAYRTGAMEAFILRRAIRVNSVILATSSSARTSCRNSCRRTAARSGCCRRCATCSATARWAQQIEAFTRDRPIMSTGDQPPSVRAAESCPRRAESAGTGLAHAGGSGRLPSGHSGN